MTRFNSALSSLSRLNVPLSSLINIAGNVNDEYFIATYHIQLHGGTTFRNNFSNIQEKQLWPTCQVVSGESCGCNIHIGGITYTSHEACMNAT